MSEERRKSIRIKKPISVQYSYKENNKWVWDMSLLKDLSDTGLCIGTNRCFSKHESFFLRLKLPLKPFESLELNSKVIESNKCQAGPYITRLEFINVTEKQKELIREYIAWILVKERGGK
jgi:c-di-GMP-binding flagellar brake protein YcgR